MKPERWKKIEKLYHAALERAAGERAAFLEEACGAEAELRREVESLLEQEDGAKSFLESPALEVAAQDLAQEQGQALIGKQIGSYQVLSLLGAGGMGEVYLAQDQTLDRKVALKFLPQALQQDERARQRFLREAKSAAALDHPFICHIHEIGEVDGTAFIAMEYVEGETLEQRLAKGAFPLKEALEKAAEMAEALEVAHKRRIVHRDLKPANIMLTEEGHVKVMDFGLAKRLTSAEGAEGQEQRITASLTQTGMTLGTVAYMSPEQLRGEEVDTRSDIFSFGVVLYEMLTGVHPFKKSQAMETGNAILNEAPDTLSQHMNEVPSLLQHMVKKMLAKEPDRRYQSIHEVRINLEELKEEFEHSRVETGEAATRPIEATGPAPRRSRERLWMTASVLLGLGLAVVLATTYWRPEATETQASRFSIFPPENTTFGPFALSPDGRHLAFVANSPDGERRLWVRPLDSLTARPLRGTEEADYPFWSPDSRFIGFFADEKLKTIALSGGAAQPLCDALGGRGATWNRDGVIVFTSGFMQRIPAAGGVPTVTTAGRSRGSGGLRWPQFLPDGRQFLYFKMGGGGPDEGIEVASLDSEKKQRILNTDLMGVYAPPGYLLFVREETLMAQPFDAKTPALTGEAVPIAKGVGQMAGQTGRNRYVGVSASENGVLAYHPSGALPIRRLVWVDRDGQEEPLAAKPRLYTRPRLSPDGKRFAVDADDRDIWIYDLAGGVPTRLTFDPATDWFPLWTPDGQRVVFASVRHGGEHNLYWKAADGTGPVERLTTSPNGQLPYSFSPDGKSLVYNELNPETGGDVHVLSMEGERTSQPLLRTPFHERNPALSPDGQRMAYLSSETGQRELYVSPFPNPEDAKYQISSGGGRSPVWGPEGRELFYRSLNGEAMMVVAIQTEPRFSAENPRVLFTGRYSMDIGRQYDISPDGQRFLMMKDEHTEETRTELIIVQNWFRELQRRVPTGQ